MDIETEPPARRRMTFLAPSHRLFSQIASLGLAATTLPFTAIPLSAATIFKANNTTDLNLSASWSSAPGIDNISQWNSTVTAANTTNLGADLALLGLEIIAPTGNVTINNGNTLTLGMGGINMSAATANLNIHSNLTTKAYINQVWNIASGRTLTLNQGTFTRSVGSTVAVQGTGLVNIGTTSTGIANNPSTGIVGPWLTIASGSTVRYAMVQSGTGNLVVFNPGVVTAPAAIIGATPNTNFDINATTGTFGAGASVNTLRHSGAASTLAGDIQTNGVMNAGTGTLTLSGNVTIGNSQELVLDTAINNITLNGVISNNTAGASSLTKTSSNTLTLAGNNTYSGDTYVNRGTVIITHNNALGVTSGGAAGTTYINGGDNASSGYPATNPGGNPALIGGQVRLDGSGAPGGGLTIAENFVVLGRGNGQNPNAFVSNNGNNILTGLYTLSGSGGGSRISVTAGTLKLSGGVAVTSDQVGLFILNPDDGTTLSFTDNPIILKSDGTVHLDTKGTVEIGVTGNVWGKTTIISGTMKMMAVNALPSAAYISMGATYGNNNETLDLNGFSQSTGYLANTNNNTGSAVNRKITNSSSTAATLTLNQSTNGTYQGLTSGNLSIVKTGSSTLTLNSTGTHTGDTRVEAGTLALASIDALSGSTLDTHTSGSQAVTFTVSGTNTYNLGGLKGTDDLAIGANSISVGANDLSTTYAGIISGTGGGLTKTGTGSLTLTNASTYTGGTTVSKGTLFANNASGTSATGTGAITVQSGATIGGNGFITTATPTGVTVQSGGILAPGGSGPDKLTINAAINLNSGAIFDAKIAIGGIAGEGNGVSGTSLLDANGTVSIGNSLLSGTWGGNSSNIFTGGTLNANQRFWLIDNDGSDAITGMFANANTLGDANVQAMFGGSAPAYTTTLSGQQFALFYNANFDTLALTGGNDLLIIAIPEPSRATLLMLALATLILHRRKRPSIA